MKAYVIKNKEGKYFGYCDSENNRFEFSNKPKRFIMFNTLRDAKKIKNLWEMNKCDIVEITIAEGDLEQQLAEKDKEIEELKTSVEYWKNEVFKKMEVKLTGVTKEKIQEIRKQVCDKIREKLQMNEQNTCENTAFGVYYDFLKEILDQIEKGEE